VAAATLYERYLSRSEHVEDFWGRRGGLPLTAEVTRFGRAFRLRADHAGFVEALAHTASKYSQAEPTPGSEFTLEAAVAEGSPDPGSLPPDVAPYLSYTGRGRWLCVAVGAWGTAHVDLPERRARIVVHPSLAEDPAVLGDRLLDTVVLNLLIGSGMGMLHASCLVSGHSTMLLLGDHNTGKTTTSLRAVQSGAFDLLTDSMVFIDRTESGAPRLHGFPVGRLKLRADVAEAFAASGGIEAGQLRTELVRAETKRVLDLRRYAPDRMRVDAVVPSSIELCLLRRNGAESSLLRPATGAEVADAVVTNSLYYDTPEAWRPNAGQVAGVLEICRCHHLEAGTQVDHLIALLRELAGRD
jgi:hypothetical protein